MKAIEATEGITYLEALGPEQARDIERAVGPNAKTACPTCHSTHSYENRNAKDLSVETEKGHWHCHRCGWSSGLGKVAKEKAMPPPPPPTPIKENLPSTLEEWAATWFEEERGIPRQIAMDYGVVSNATTIYFPYTVGGVTVNVKRRSGELPRLKTFGQAKGASRSLFGMDQARGAKVVVVVEGELDVLACASAGWAAVSPPDGAPGINVKTGVVAEVGAKGTAFKTPEGQAFLREVDKFIIATDADAEGQALASWLIQELTAEKCWQVSWPDGCKDANDVLKHQGIKGLDSVLEQARAVPLPGVRPLSAHREAVYRLHREGYAPGVSSGWEQFDQFYRPELGKLLVVSGYSSHGKTSWLNHLISNLAKFNQWNVALYSPEQGEEGEMLAKFIQINSDMPLLPGADERIPEELLEWSINWVGDRFFEITSEDTDDGGFSSLTIPRILELTDPAVVRNNIKMLVIDPWNEIENARPKGMTGEEYISASLSTLRNWAKRNNVLTCIVIHPRKPDYTKNWTEEHAPGPFEGSGAAHWYNKADIYLAVHRVKYGPDRGKTTVHVQKHRKEGITGMIGSCEFRFDKRSGRFYVEGTTIPERIGTNPYIDFPAHLTFSHAAPTSTLDLWTEDEELF